MSTVNTFLKNGVFEIELNRPESLNAFNKEMSIDLALAIKKAGDDPEVRAVLVYGSGKGFCAGGDLKDFGMDATNPVEVKEFLQKGHEVTTGIYNMEKPVIAAVHGPAVGAGCNLAFGCDLIIADENAVFSEIFAKVGALPDMGGLYFLPQKIGMHKAAELVFTGKKVSASEALDMGLINEVVPNGTAIEKGRELAVSLAKGPTKTLGMAKRIMHQAAYSKLEDILELEAYGQAIVFQSRDFKEGRAAFLEKRKAEFLGY
ncbi:enoyl-CoA hydratase/isomerase family protein [Sporosarcina sp. CAU 1771]